MMSANCMCLRDSIQLLFLWKTPKLCNSDATTHCYTYVFVLLSSTTRPEEELVAMFHAANGTIGIDKVRRNETTIAQNILTSSNKFANNECVYIKKPNIHASQMYQKQHMYPSIKQSKSVLRLIAIKHCALQYFQKLPLGKRPKQSF